MSIEEKCLKLAEEIVSGLPIRSNRIREELTNDLANSIEMEVDSTIEMADMRIEDYEEGAIAGVATTDLRPHWWEFWRAA